MLSAARRRGIAAHATTLTLALALSGCAINPVVDWTRPAEPANARTLDSMEGARAYARAYKDAVHLKARDYVDAQNRLNDNLLALGVFTVGSLLYKAPTDVSLGLAGLFGATYIAGQQNLGKSRLDVYQSGIGATNCAVAAVAPLNFSTTELQQITTESNILRHRELPSLASLLAATRVSFASSGITEDAQKRPIQDQLDAAAASYQAGLNLLNDTSQLPGRVSAAAAGLKGTVDTIAAQVDKLATNTVADPASVAKSIGNLASIVGSPAPGAGLDTAFTSRVNPTAAKGGTPSTAGTASFAANLAHLNQQMFLVEGQAAPPPPPRDPNAKLADALASLASAQALVEGRVKQLGGRIAASKTFGNGSAEALKQCGVSDTLIALRVVDPALPIVVKSSSSDAVTQEIHVTGGVKNYTGHMTRTAAGVDITSPPAGANVFVLKVPKDAAKAGDLDLEATLEDSSGQFLKLPMKVTKP